MMMSKPSDTEEEAPPTLAPAALNVGSVADLERRLAEMGTQKKAAPPPPAFPAAPLMQAPAPVALKGGKNALLVSHPSKTRRLKLVAPRVEQQFLGFQAKVFLWNSLTRLFLFHFCATTHVVVDRIRTISTEMIVMEWNQLARNNSGNSLSISPGSHHGSKGKAADKARASTSCSHGTASDDRFARGFRCTHHGRFATTLLRNKFFERRSAPRL